MLMADDAQSAAELPRHLATGPSDWPRALDHAKCVRTYVAGTALAQLTASLSSV